MNTTSMRPGRRLAALGLMIAAIVGLMAWGAGVLTAGLPEAGLSSQLGGVVSVHAQAGEDLQVEKTHASPGFTINSQGVYTITVNNSGTAPVNGPITVTDVLDDDFTFVSVAGDGWTPCAESQKTVTCVYSNTNGVAVGDTLPPIRLTVDLGLSEQTSILNTALISNTNDTNPANDQADDPTQILGVDLQVSKAVTPTAPVENASVAYTLRVDNHGPNEATGVSLTDVLPSGITYASSTASQGSYAPGTGIWTIGNLTNGAAVTLTLNATVNAGTRGQTITNNVTALTADQEDPIQSNNTASVSFTVATTRVRGIVTDASTDQVLTGVEVILTDSAQRQFEFTTAANGWYTFTSTTAQPIAAGSARLTVEHQGYADFSLTRNLVAGEDHRIDIPLDTADLVVTLTDGLTTMRAGQLVTYTVTIANEGTITATNVIITDVFDTRQDFITHTLGITYTEESATTFVWELDEDIPPDDQISFKIAVEVDSALPSSSYAMTNQVMASTDAPEADKTDNKKLDTDTATGTASISITKSVSPTSVQTNQDATYRITVENTGNVPLTDVEIYDVFSSYFDLRSATSSLGTVTRNNSTRTVEVDIDVLEPDDETTVTVVVRVNTTATSNQTVSNQADVDYTYGGNSNLTRRSGTATVRIIATGSLPGTGGIELDPPQRAPSRAPLVAGFSALLLILIGAGALGYAWRSRDGEWSAWATRMGLVFFAFGIIFGFVGIGLNARLNGGQSSASDLASRSWEAIAKVRPTRPPEHYEIFFPTPDSSGEPETLPDFPIPTPTLQPEVEPGEESPDTSPVNRIVIPVLALDTIVKYVPYDGLTWLIAGLQREVAWMGDTSWPGLGSNTALAGHVTLRTGADGPFRHLYLLQPGDRVTVYTEQNSYNYSVRESVVAEETDMDVINSTGTSQLTLITCTDWDEENEYYARRLVVYADLYSVLPIDRLSAR